MDGCFKSTGAATFEALVISVDVIVYWVFKMTYGCGVYVMLVHAMSRIDQRIRLTKAPTLPYPTLHPYHSHG